MSFRLKWRNLVYIKNEIPRQARNDSKLRFCKRIIPFLEVFFKPKLERQERPNPGGIVDSCCIVVVQYFFYLLFFEKTSLYGFFREEDVISILLQLSSKPTINRHAESHFRTEHHFIGDDAAERFFEDVFFVIETFNFQIEGNFCRKLQHFMIEKWRSSFESDGHRVNIYFYQQVIRKVCCKIRV